MDRQTLRDWVIRYNEQGPDGLIDIPSPGAPPNLTTRQSLSPPARGGRPDPCDPRRGRWRACDLIMRLHDEFGLSVSDERRSLALKDLGFSHVSVPAEGPLQRSAERHSSIQKKLPARRRNPRNTPRPARRSEVWFQMELRVDQKDQLTYRWAKEKAPRPRAIHDRHTQSTSVAQYCPGRGAALLSCSPLSDAAEAMQLAVLDEIATKVTQRTCRSHSRSSRIARRQRPRGPETLRACPVAAARERQSSTLKKHMTVHASQKLAIKTHIFKILRRHRRPLLLHPGRRSSISTENLMSIARRDSAVEVDLPNERRVPGVMTAALCFCCP